MKPLIIVVCASLAGALIAAGCTSGDGGPASGSSPFGTDPPPSTGYEPPGVTGLDPPPSSGTPSNGSIEELCAFDCQHIESMCPGGGGTNCAAGCVQAESYFPGCETQFRAYLSCVATASITCSSGNATINGCDAQISALTSCSQGGAAAAQ